MGMDQGLSRKMRRVFLVLNVILLAIGTCGGPLILRLYFLHGGARIWLSSWLQTGGWPINFIPLLAAYLQRRRMQGLAATTVLIKPPIFWAAAVIGVLTGFDDYLYAYGLAKLPVSTSSLIIASQLGFTALFAFLLVKQKFTSYTVNAIVLLTIGAGVLALHTSGDRPKGESNKDYSMGFTMTLAASALYGLILPMVELTYKKAKQAVTYTLVLEIQVVMCFFATVVCTVGMAINNDFRAIAREGRGFELGETKYYVVLFFSGIIFQCFFLGTLGVIFSCSSLLSAIVIAVLLPVTEVLAVIFYKEKFQAEKGVSLVLSLWGFVSYFFGEIKHDKQKNTETQPLETEMPQSTLANIP
ncbi:purine permease 3-like [Diospyros lotus]|uniref:purine permease 3-like n=1 Tax=Diospyros lotus TaxID=55363 RepID=UPI0022560FFB|nr:purine permease 3-like [Diospyros lotus]